MPADHERAIAELKEKIEKAKGMKYRYEARLEQLAVEREKILAELKDLGVTPEGLEGEITRLNGEVEALLKEAGAMLPADLLGR